MFQEANIAETFKVKKAHEKWSVRRTKDCLWLALIRYRRNLLLPEVVLPNTY
jgi:hypothetical protein